MEWTKAGILAKLAFKNPQEFADRLEAIATSRLDKWLCRKPQYPRAMSEEALSRMAITLGSPPNWEGWAEIELEVQRRMATLERTAPFTTKHHGDLSLARLCYAACRLLAPQVVVETGVAYGVTTAFVLQALRLNNKGTLYSIDLPPLGKNADDYGLSRS